MNIFSTLMHNSLKQEINEIHMKFKAKNFCGEENCKCLQSHGKWKIQI